MNIVNAGSALVLCLMITGCSGIADQQPKGQWVEDAGIQQVIETGTVFPNHTYYYVITSYSIHYTKLYDG